MTKIETFETLAEETGWGLLPLNGKKPFEEKWERYCEEKKSFNKTDYENGNNAGIPCGPANGVIVLDVDDVDKFKTMMEEKGWNLPTTRIHETGRGLPHFFYEYPKNGHIYGCTSVKDPDGEIDSTSGKVKTVFDIKGLGGQVVAPGSIHPETGKPYTLKQVAPIAPCPQWILDLVIRDEPAKGEAEQVQPWDGQLDSLPISYAMKKLIKDGEVKGRRSEAIMSVVNALVRVKLSDEAIIAIFEKYPIGEKYHEKNRTRERWLLKQVEKARNYVSESVKISQTSLDFPPVFSGVAGEYSELQGKYIEAPPQFPYTCFLTGLGALTTGRLTLATVHKPQPRLYAVLLGPSGESRKSTTIEQAIDFFRRSITRDFNLNVCHGVGSDIGLLRKLKKNKSLLLSLDEFKSLTSKSAIKASSLLPAIATLFDQNRYENQTKHESIILEDAHLSILAASTPETYESCWSPEFTSIGLNNRLWIVPGEGERGQAFPPEISESEYMPIKRGLGEILSLVGESLKLNLSEHGKELYSNWYQERENSIHSQRLESYALRLIALLTVNDLQTEVDEITVKRVIQLCDWQLQARKLYTPVDADNVTAKMEEKIRRVLEAKGDLSKRELFIFTNARRVGRYYFEHALTNLIKGDEVGFNKKTKGYWFKA